MRNKHIDPGELTSVKHAMLLSILFLSVTLLVFSYSPACAWAVPNGDINGDGVVNAGDVGLAQRIAMGYVSTTPDQLSRGDVAPINAPDGVINAGDVVVVQRIAMGLITVYTITASANANGLISPSGTVSIISGATLTFMIMPTSGYLVSDVVVDGVSKGAITSYTFTEVTASHTITASFAVKNAYTITASAGANGTISPSGVFSVDSGATATVTITPTTEYHVADVLVDGATVGAVTAYTFTNVTADHTIAASFAINTYTITASAGDSGTISPSGVVNVNSGANMTFTITPIPGYNTADVLVDGASVGAVSTYTFPTVTADHTITASFAEDVTPPPPISLVRTTVDLANGVATIAGGVGSVEGGATVSVRNNRTGSSQTQTAAADGSVMLSIEAQEGDKLAITVIDQHLNTSTIPDAQGNPIALETVVTALVDPAARGALPVGVLALDDPNGLSGVTDPAWFQTPAEDPNPTLAWAKIMYPAMQNGAGAPVHASGPWPVVLFLHGRHYNCDPDGGSSSDLNYTCDYDYWLCFRARCANDSQRIPSHEGHDYLMEKLASHGLFVISVSAHELQLYEEQWNIAARGRLVLRFLDKLRDWTQNGTDPFGGRFAGKLDMTRIGLVGHSRGGEGVVAAQSLNPGWPPESSTPAPHSIKTIVSIAPTDNNRMGGRYDVTDSSHLLVLGARDGDVSDKGGFRVYDRAYPDPVLGCGAQSTGRLPKAVSYAYSANHNYFNTIWTDERDSEYWTTSPNPWAGACDDNYWITPKLSAAAQRRVALTAVVPFLRWQLLGEENYREVLTGEHRFSQGPSEVFWTFQDGVRKALDNFEQVPVYDTSTNPFSTYNTLAGLQTLSDFSYILEGSLYLRWFITGDLRQGVGLPNHTDTKWLMTTWEAGKQGLIESYLPPCNADLSAYRYLSFRATRLSCTAPDCDLPVNLLVNIEDASGRSTGVNLRTDFYAVLPAPPVYTPSQFSGVRIPLSHFTANGSQVDLRNISRIRIFTDRDFDAMALDDIEFGN